MVINCYLVPSILGYFLIEWKSIYKKNKLTWVQKTNMTAAPIREYSIRQVFRNPAKSPKNLQSSSLKKSIPDHHLLQGSYRTLHEWFFQCSAIRGRECRRDDVGRWRHRTVPHWRQSRCHVVDHSSENVIRCVGSLEMTSMYRDGMGGLTPLPLVLFDFRNCSEEPDEEDDDESFFFFLITFNICSLE